MSNESSTYSLRAPKKKENQLSFLTSSTPGSLTDVCSHGKFYTLCKNNMYILYSIWQNVEIQTCDAEWCWILCYCARAIPSFLIGIFSSQKCSANMWGSIVSKCEENTFKFINKLTENMIFFQEKIYDW